MIYFSDCFQNAIRLLTVVTLLFAVYPTAAQSPEKIDRHALVVRHNVKLNSIDTLGALSVGNGEFSFTVDASGLQSFYKDYENGIPVGTLSQWAWHRSPSKERHTLQDVLTDFESCDGTRVPYAVQYSQGKRGEATHDLRANPHRLQLGLIGLVLLKRNQEEVQLQDLEKIDQQLDLWSGKIQTTYAIEGIPVKVILYCHQQEDRIAARVESPLISQGRLRVKFDFPYGSDCHTCAGYDFNRPEKHSSIITLKGKNAALIARTLDTTSYDISIQWEGKGQLKQGTQLHHVELHPSKTEEALEFTVLFSPKNLAATMSTVDFKAVEQNSIEQWKLFWNSGGAIDFSKCTDARANELERRVILSQYLTKIQCSGSLPPQETGLTMNSWHGKFHLEMHWWHAAHFALWNRSVLLHKSMQWYTAVMPKARATAMNQGYRGVRWPKMTDPFGNESPSNVGTFIIWQQPHPIYFAELLYRNDSTRKTLVEYQDIVFNTADFMASFLKRREGYNHLCHPLIPAQEIFKATDTDDPVFELQYWYYALVTAQQWRFRLGLNENKIWREAIENLAPLSIANGRYLPNATTPDAYTEDLFRRDHPAVLGAYGFIPANNRMDTTIMLNTFLDIVHRWQWETTWGWDYSLMAMTATRLNQPEQAIDALLMDVKKNTYLRNGHNYQDERLRLYLPGNGGLLAAVALMAAGWDGCMKSNPGFPSNGKWNVAWEGLRRMP